MNATEEQVEREHEEIVKQGTIEIVESVRRECHCWGKSVLKKKMLQQQLKLKES